MAAIDPEGGQAYFFEGLPFTGVKTAADANAQKFWLDGMVADYVIPASDGGIGSGVGHGGLSLLGVGS